MAVLISLRRFVADQVRYNLESDQKSVKVLLYNNKYICISFHIYLIERVLICDRCFMLSYYVNKQA